jgi:hypothetical protein
VLALKLDWDALRKFDWDWPYRMLASLAGLATAIVYIGDTYQRPSQVILATSVLADWEIDFCGCCFSVQGRQRAGNGSEALGLDCF